MHSIWAAHPRTHLPTEYPPPGPVQSRGEHELFRISWELLVTNMEWSPTQHEQSSSQHYQFDRKTLDVEMQVRDRHRG